MSLQASEFIQNSDGSIYHLNLLPHQLAHTIITVGDPDRVQKITKHFDTIECTVRKREFHTQTGNYNGKRISVVSTGIGTDNIDIVLNELDALVNIDFKTREIKKELTSLEIIRIGTSGALHKDIPVDSFLVSEKAVGFDALMNFYETKNILDLQLGESLINHINWPKSHGTPYVVSGNKKLVSLFSKGFHKGITMTNCGFYGPQGRVLRLALKDVGLNDKLASFSYNKSKITNMEMETAGIYGLAALLGHKAVSLNAIIANRETGEFSKDPEVATRKLIQHALDILAA